MPNASPVGTRPALSILVVEDDRDRRDGLRRDLLSRGCRVTTAGNCVDGLEAIVLAAFDAVVSNVVMLPRGGAWLWREATGLRPELRGRFVFCDADAVLDSFHDPLRSERFLPKPLDLNVLWAEIVAATGRRVDQPS